MTTYPVSPERHDSDPSLAELLGAGERMAPHWVVPADPAPAPVSPAAIHGVVVPDASARLIAASAYGG
ncbi:hypothetical protein ACIQRS_27850 [Streptomyces termitum]|uniref:Uncharacterized protein n=1 Tax=Streptomyces termitum TaxID=67368 RepID=A0A918T0U5_9ACTN|nr:hypothetical protein [Streptomyces termitum]GHA83615.1 hypothetical protein GCM10010305_29460 [Streptomyces termitum]